MTLNVEDGTGLPDADALISSEYADQFHDDHGNVAWATYDQQEKEAAIRNATLFLSGALVYMGFPTNQRTQALAFPRTGLLDRYEYDVDDNSVPREVEQCTALLALFEVQNVGSIANPVYEPNKELIRKRIGPIEKEYAIFRQDPQAARPQIIAAMELIAPFLASGGPQQSGYAGTRSR